MTWTRRKFGGFAGASLVAALGARAARSQTKARVVVIGGGIGGATVAKYLATSSAKPDVTLVEPKTAIYDLLLQQPLSCRHSLAGIAHP